MKFLNKNLLMLTSLLNLSCLNDYKLMLINKMNNRIRFLNMAQISTRTHYTNLYKTKVVNKLINIFVDNLTLFLKIRSYYVYITDPTYYTMQIIGKYDTELLYIKSFNSPLYRDFQSILETQSADLIQAFDALSEKIIALGAPIPHTYRQFGNLTSISQEIDQLILKEVIEIIINDHKKMLDSIQYLLDLTGPMNDTIYKALLEERIINHTQHIEKLKSFLLIINNSKIFQELDKS